MFLSRSSKSNNKKKILVCEDDPSIVEIISFVLTEKGYSVLDHTSCTNIDDIKSAQPDLILLDLWMPMIDGPAIAKSLKADIQTKTIPIIIVSANNEIEKISQEIGADGCLRKPFNLEDLEAIVEKFINSA